MADYSIHYEISLISKGLYRLVSNIVGPECIVKLRRRRWCSYDVFQNIYNIDKTLIVSGSRAEGLNFQTSDFDGMFMDKSTLVIPSHIPMNYYLSDKYRTENRTILQMVTDNVTPGFAFVKCLSCDINNIAVYRSLVMKESGIYVISKHIRETFASTSISYLHGPCQTQHIFGAECDSCYSLKCPVWPTQARSFINRSIHQGWPTYTTLTDICKDGCLLVPINSKLQQYNNMVELEWRISFSLAEKKLIYSMNHCQFLCYGLLKVFLNECLKTVLPNGDDLCSYYMKTAVFWEISDNSSDWAMSLFLCKFWKIFRRVIKWVSTGYCPNFFIPENNMFFGKICGEKQRTVLGILCELYSDGYWCLLHCTSLNGFLSRLIALPEIADALYDDENDYVPKSLIERYKLSICLTFDLPLEIMKEDSLMQILNNILSQDLETQEEVVKQGLLVNHVLNYYAERLLFFFRFFNSNQNRMLYKDLRKAQTLLCGARTFVCTNYFILIKLFYMVGNYRKTIEMIHYVTYKLQTESFMYVWDLNNDFIMTAVHQGMSFDKLIKSFIVKGVMIDDQTTIDELMLETLNIMQNTGASLLEVPPLVFLNFLLFLSYTKLGEYQRRRDVLEELYSILHYDDGKHIYFRIRAISWEILGICQQLYGDRHSALQSYIYALHDQYNYFKQITVTRINSLGTT